MLCANWVIGMGVSRNFFLQGGRLDERRNNLLGLSARTETSRCDLRKLLTNDLYTYTQTYIHTDIQL